MRRDGRASWLWAIVVASLVLTAVQVTELVAIVGPAAVALLAPPLAIALVAGLVLLAFANVPQFGPRQHRQDPWANGEPTWPARCASWSVGRAPQIGAIHGRDGPGFRAPRL
jgi:hypothetical protein